MRQKTIDVHGLSFIQVDILGCYLPTRTAIESVLDEIRDKRNKKKICEHFNRMTIAHGQRFDIPIDYQSCYTCEISFRVEHTDEDIIYNLNKILSMIMATQCTLSGYDFNLLAQNLFTVNWFEGVLGGYNFNIQELYRMTGSWLKEAKNPSKNTGKYENLEIQPPSQRKSKYSDYIVARVVNESFNDLVFEQARYDKRMRYLIYEELSIGEELFRVLKNNKDKIAVTVCMSCYMPFEGEQIPSVKICSKCQGERQKEKGASRRQPRYGWEFDRRGNCEECANKRKIDEPGFCLKCHQKKYAQK
jgi:hypothetical protein